MYNISLCYYPVEGKGLAITRALMIDGEVPFSEVRRAAFSRIWKDKEPSKVYDINGNQIRAGAEETPDWTDQCVSDTTGLYSVDFFFYLSGGDHILTLAAGQEPLALHSIRIYVKPSPPAYSEYSMASRINGGAAAGYGQVIQAEEPLHKSDPMLYAMYDRSSPVTYPYSLSKVTLNYIGGFNWRLPGQWIEWEVEAPEDGWYNLAFRARQNYRSGMYSTRKLYLDGEIPFAEAGYIRFSYSGRWINDSIRSDAGEPYMLYLEKGKHVIRLEETAGDMTEAIQALRRVLYSLTALYQNVIMLTGAEPDIYRDYKFEQTIPGFLEIIAHQSEMLKTVKDSVESKTGKRGGELSVLRTFAIQLDDIAKKPYTLASRLGQFRSNISALGALGMSLMQQPLDIDCITLQSPGGKLPKSDVGFFGGLWNEIKSLFISYVVDYSTIGVMEEHADSLSVWIPTGRDQANILSVMSSELFAPRYNANVNIRLVTADVLLPAIASGNGPDVMLQIGRDIPVNFGIRGALADLGSFGDYSTVAGRFSPGAAAPLGYGGKQYALPETESFNMLFYRSDIFAMLDVQPPDTWSDFFVAMRQLKHNQLEVGMAFDINTFAIFLFQNGGVFYHDDGRASALDDESAIRSFKLWTALHSDYKIPLTYDALNRFRTGEMPMLISEFTFYNALNVFCPEIDGDWKMIPVPGSVTGGDINRSVSGNGSCAVILESSGKKDLAWDFLKWWTSADTQVRYGMEMEYLLGPSVRYPTANLGAFSRLPWLADQYDSIERQREEVIPIPEVPGSYFTSRHLINAFRKVALGKADPRDTILNYVETINNELAAKRVELGFDN